LWRIAEASAAERWLLSAAYRLASVAITDPESAGTHADVVVGLCHQTTLNASEPDLWMSAAALVAAAFQERVTWQGLLQIGNGYAGEYAQLLRAVAYLVQWVTGYFRDKT